MPTAVKMQAEYGDDLQVVFVESQGHTMQDVEKLALQKKWFGTGAVWTTERPVITGAKGIPNFVMLSAEGEVVLKGNPNSMHKQVEEHIAEFRKSRGKAPKDLPKALSGAYKDLAKGKLADALAAARKVEADAGDDAAVAEAAGKFAGEIEATANRAIAQLTRAIDEGWYSFAAQRGKQLAKDLAGCPLEAELKKQLDRLDSEELAAEIKAEKALQQVEKKLYTKGGDKATKNALAAVAKKHSGTKAAARAESLAAAIEE